MKHIPKDLQDKVHDINIGYVIGYLVCLNKLTGTEYSELFTDKYIFSAMEHLGKDTDIIEKALEKYLKDKKYE